MRGFDVAQTRREVQTGVAFLKIQQRSVRALLATQNKRTMAVLGAAGSSSVSQTASVNEARGSENSDDGSALLSIRRFTADRSLVRPARFKQLNSPCERNNKST